MMRKVSIHYDYKVTGAEVEPMDICSPAHKFTTGFAFYASSEYSPESKLPCPWFKKLEDNESSIDERDRLCSLFCPRRTPSPTEWLFPVSHLGSHHLLQ
jgi:hypothetical protein